MSTINHYYHVDTMKLKHLVTRFDKDYGILWMQMASEPRSCVTGDLLTSCNQLLEFLECQQGQVMVQGEVRKSEYLVLSSSCPGVFNLGGDLELFSKAIQSGAYEVLQAYGRLCVDNIWRFYSLLQSRVTTLALVQGQALGGGFEAALAASVIIAERSARFGFPETNFSLFAGMGSLSMLSRKVGMQIAETMVYSGKTYTATELFKLGVVDILAEDGQGEVILHKWVTNNHSTMNSFQAIKRAIQRAQQLTLEELYDIVDIWVDAALRLKKRDLKVMARLVQAQFRMSNVTPENNVNAPVLDGLFIPPIATTSDFQSSVITLQ